MQAEPWGPAVLVGGLDEGDDPWDGAWKHAVEVLERALQFIITQFLKNSDKGLPSHVFRHSSLDEVTVFHWAVRIADALVSTCRCGADYCLTAHVLSEAQLETRPLGQQLRVAAVGLQRFKPGAFAKSMLADDVFAAAERRVLDTGWVTCEKCSDVPDDMVGHVCPENGTVLRRWVRRNMLVRADAVVSVAKYDCRSCSDAHGPRLAYVRPSEVRRGSCPYCQQPIMAYCYWCSRGRDDVVAGTRGRFRLDKPWEPCDGPGRHQLKVRCGRKGDCAAEITEDGDLRCAHGLPGRLYGLRQIETKVWVFKTSDLPLEDRDARSEP